VALVLENGHLYEEARIAGQSRDHFLVALNHELRTPATALLLESDILRSGLLGELPPRTSEMLERARPTWARSSACWRGSGAGRGADAVRGDRAGGAAEVRGHPPPPRGAHGAPQGAHPLAPLPARPPPAADRPGRLSRVLLHLLDNAIRFTDEGKIEVRLTRTTRPARARRIRVLEVAVSDTGHGIPADELERVFEPFAQVQEGARSASSERGVGLGLALARRLARTLSAEVKLESELGRGTTASLILPYQ
jgi:signal transduction histidine kinase